jgi:hypothetical protein
VNSFFGAANGHTIDCRFGGEIALAKGLLDTIGAKDF